MTPPRRTIGRVLIANRGEIAVRVIKTCRLRSIESVAICSVEDSDALHVRLADRVAHLSGSGSAAYLNVAEIVEHCVKLEVDAVHPGYGFLSENEEFCAALEHAGIVFLGPTPLTMRQFGLKHEARLLAISANVPVVPGSELLESMEAAVETAARLGYPVMLKLTGGGGGIGIQICESESDLVGCFERTKQKGSSFFNHDGIYLERYYPSCRHIEVQLFGNGLGDVIAVGERECSVQRRHQKVIEEAPSPFVCQREGASQLRERLCEAACRLGRLVKYRNAGTVEFLVDDRTGDFFFLEVNTRLQVEHGVTELVHGIDLVDWMIRQGEAQLNPEGGIDAASLREELAANCSSSHATRHAIEVRVYAENPAKNFQPSPGLLTRVSFPTHLPFARFDSWVESGTVITPMFDPLIAKVLVVGEHRHEAVHRMIQVLEACDFSGPVNNVAYLQAILRHQEFAAGRATTRFLDSMPFTPHLVDVVHPGAFTTVQDFPARRGVSWGVPPSGPMDCLAAQVASILVGNPRGTETLELTFSGPTLYFHVPALIALTGAPASISVNQLPVAMWQAIHVAAGSTVEIGSAKGHGGRMYLAIAGGISVPARFGSKATFPTCSLGGYQGRQLRVGDGLSVTPYSHETPHQPAVSAKTIDYGAHWQVAVTLGPHAEPDYFLAEDVCTFFATSWRVHHNSNRMGIRLLGPKLKWARAHGGEGGSHPSNILDYGYPIGAINFTGDMPVILTVDGPSMGGFVCLATIIEADLWKVGQARPGDTIQFVQVSLAYALQARMQLHSYLEALERYPDRTDAAHLSTIVSVEPQRISSAAILETIVEDPARGQPRVQYRQAGDRYILVEYGNDTIDLNIRARVQLLQKRLAAHSALSSKRALVELVPNVLSLLVHYEPDELSQSALLAVLIEIERSLPDASEQMIPSRLVHLPIAIDDRWSRAAIEQYAQGIRPDAPYVPSNIEFIARVNGFEVSSINDFATKLISSPILVTGVGFYVGTPFAIPLDPRVRMVVPKYNPARTFTPEGAVGLGGSIMAIYPVASPGGYQLFGRTVMVWDTYSDHPRLFHDFDQIVFHAVSDDELEAIRLKMRSGQYTIKIEDTQLDMKQYNEFLASIDGEIVAFREQQRAAALAERERELAYAAAHLSNSPAATVSASTSGLSSAKDDSAEALMRVEADISASVWQVKVAEGDRVQKGSVLFMLEAMKMEVPVVCPSSGVVRRLAASQGQVLEAGDLLCLLDVDPAAIDTA